MSPSKFPLINHLCTVSPFVLQGGPQEPPGRSLQRQGGGVLRSPGTRGGGAHGGAGPQAAGRLQVTRLYSDPVIKSTTTITVFEWLQTGEGGRGAQLGGDAVCGHAQQLHFLRRGQGEEEESGRRDGVKTVSSQGGQS